MNYLDERLGQTSYPFRRIWRKFFSIIQQNSFLPSPVRVRLLRLAGVKIGNRCFIGDNVVVDGIRPDLIEIGEHVGITSGCKVLTHFMRPEDRAMLLGRVIIEDDVFIGMNTLIVAPVTIGKGSVIAAGSVLTKDIPPYEIWGGVPAKFIRKRNRQ